MSPRRTCASPMRTGTRPTAVDPAQSRSIIQAVSTVTTLPRPVGSLWRLRLFCRQSLSASSSAVVLTDHCKFYERLHVRHIVRLADYRPSPTSYHHADPPVQSTRRLWSLAPAKWSSGSRRSAWPTLHTLLQARRRCCHHSGAGAVSRSPLRLVAGTISHFGASRAVARIVASGHPTGAVRSVP